MLELTRVRRNREIAREPVLRDLPPPLLVGVELYQACSLLANTGNIVEVQDGGGTRKKCKTSPTLDSDT